MEYEVLEELLSSSGSPLPPAELHGGLCGLICANGQRAAMSWLESLLEDCSGDSASLSELAVGLSTLGEETFSAFTGSSLEFRPLLPDDDSGVDVRSDALAHWCHGFLSGLVIGGLELDAERDHLPADIHELVGDFAEISKAGADAAEIEDPELGARSLFELIEYVRVGAQLIFEELLPSELLQARTIH